MNNPTGIPILDYARQQLEDHQYRKCYTTCHKILQGENANDYWKAYASLLLSCIPIDPIHTRQHHAFVALETAQALIELNSTQPQESQTLVQTLNLLAADQVLKLYTEILFERAFRAFEAGQHLQCKIECGKLDAFLNLSKAQEDFKDFFNTDSRRTFAERTEEALDLARECIDKYGYTRETWGLVKRTAEIAGRAQQSRVVCLQ